MGEPGIGRLEELKTGQLRARKLGAAIPRAEKPERGRTKGTIKGMTRWSEAIILCIEVLTKGLAI